MSLVKVSISVSKLGATIPSINLPPIVTCRPDAPCRHGCYALRGNFIYKGVKNRLAENLAAYKENPKLFFDMIAEQTKLSKFCRWHSSGDIVDMEYLTGMCRVARKNKGVKYLCFTKKYELVNEYLKGGHRIPSNLRIVFSCWKDFVPENPYNFPTTWVYFPKKGENEFNGLIPEDAIPCQGKCYACQACWQLKKGQSVVFRKH